MKRVLRNNSGQVTIEFIFSFSIALIFLVFFLYFAFNFTVGYLAHYATYSASRAFLSHDIASRDSRLSMEEAIEHAKREFNNYGVNRFGLKSTNGIQFNLPGQVLAFEYVGSFFRFIPPFTTEDAEGKPHDFVSESFLGKEPTRGDCICQVLEQMDGVTCNNGISPSYDYEITVYDNGC